MKMEKSDPDSNGRADSIISHCSSRDASSDLDIVAPRQWLYAGTFSRN